MQLAEVSTASPTRADLLAEVRRTARDGHPQWWPDPPPRADRTPRACAGSCCATPALADGGRASSPACSAAARSTPGEGWVELAWPGGGRVALEQRPGDAAVDRIEIEVAGPGVTGELTVAGTRLVVSAG